MNEPFRKYMKVGIIHFMAYPETMKGEGPIEETVKQILKDDYFDVIEITWIKDAAVRRRVAKMLETSGVTVCYGAQPRLLTTGLNPNAVNETDRKKAVATLKEGLDEAAELNAAGFAFLSGRYEEDSKGEAFNALVKTTLELCGYAKKAGVPRVVLEVFDHDVDKRSLIGPAELAKKYAEAVCLMADNFGLLADLSHLPLLRESPAESLMPIKDFLVHAHMGNAVVKFGAPGYGDLHPRFGFPNSENGVQELVDYLRVLMGIGYLNAENPPTVSFEVKPFGDEDPELVIANAKRTLNEAWLKV